MTSSRSEISIALSLFVLAMVAVFLLGFDDGLTGDTIHYRAMIEGELAPPPFAYRVLTPAIVAALPLSSSDGFWLVAWSSTLGNLLVMRQLLRHLGIAVPAANASVILLCFSFPIANYLVHWERIDPLANFAFALALLLILRRQFLPASLIMAVGVLAKETLLFLLPILLWHQIRDRRRDLRAWAIAGLLCALPLLTWLGVRATVEIDPESWTVESPDDLALVVQSAWEYNVEQFGLAKRVARELTKSYGFVWALAAFGLWIDRRLRLESLYMIGIGVFLCGFATDWGRMLGTGYPGIFIPAAFFLGRLAESPHWRPLLAGLLALGAVHCYFSLLVLRELSDSARLATVVGELVVIAAGVGLAAWAYRKIPCPFDRSEAVIA